MKLYKLGCPVFLILMVFLVSNCSWGMSNLDSFPDAEQKQSLQAKEEQTSEKASPEIIITAYESKVKDKDKFGELTKGTYGDSLNLFHVIAIDPNHKTGLPNDLKNALLSVYSEPINTTLCAKTSKGFTPLKMALDVKNYLLIMDFIELKLPLIQEFNEPILHSLVSSLVLLINNELNQEDQDALLKTFTYCLDVCVNEDNSEIVNNMKQDLHTGWNKIVQHILFALYYATPPNKEAYRPLITKLVTSVSKKSPDFILEFNAEQHLQVCSESGGKCRNTYLEQYLAPWIEQAKQAKQEELKEIEALKEIAALTESYLSLQLGDQATQEEIKLIEAPTQNPVNESWYECFTRGLGRIFYGD